MKPATPDSAGAARARLVADKAMRPLDEDRTRLVVLSDRLDRAGRAALTQQLAGRVRTDRRFAPVLGRLFRMALHG